MEAGNILDYLLGYVVIINLVGFVQMGLDKKRAESHKRRIPEKQLFTVAVIGGSIGSIMGMYLYRHKTKHVTFVLIMPGLLILQLLAVYILWF